MHFAFTDDQKALRDAVRAVLTAECSPGVVRAAWGPGSGRTPSLWNGLAEIGVLGMCVRDDHGGLGLTEIDVVLVLEELGWHATPEPVVETAFLVAPLVDDAALRDALIAGSKSAAFVGPGAPHALHAASAGAVLVCDAEGAALHAPESVALEPVESVDGARRLFRVMPSGPPSQRVDPAAANRVALRATLAAAAQLVGLSRRMVDMAVEYAKVRRQFGQTIGAFQAVQHRLADATIATEFAAPLVYRAAWSLSDVDPDAALHVSMAKMMASDAATAAAKASLQVHGAIGYSFEYDLHLYMKRAWALAAAHGSAAEHRRRIADVVVGPSLSTLSQQA